MLRFVQVFLSYFWHALFFFTRLPVGRFFTHNDKDLIASRIMLPLVGVVVGSLAALVFWLISPVFSKEITVILVLGFLVFITGGFHEDALADTFDAFGSGGTKEKILTVMKDSRIGTYGTLALIFYFGLAYVILFKTNVELLPKVIFYSQVVSRFSALPLMWKLVYVRHDSIFEKAFEDHRLTLSPTRIFLAFLFTVVLGFLVFEEMAVFILIGVLFITVFSGWYYQKRIGGVTGDCFGATIKFCELFVFAVGMFLSR